MGARGKISLVSGGGGGGGGVGGWNRIPRRRLSPKCGNRQLNNKKQVEQSQRQYSLELKQVKSRKLRQKLRFLLLPTIEKL